MKNHLIFANGILRYYWEVKCVYGEIDDWRAWIKVGGEKDRDDKFKEGKGKVNNVKVLGPQNKYLSIKNYIQNIYLFESNWGIY